MKFTCTKENLSTILQQVSGIANRHANLAILNNILFSVKNSKVEIVGTNLEIAIRANLRAKTDSEGSFTVPAKTLNDFVNLLPEEQILVEKIENELVITCGDSTTKIKGSSAEEYPVIPEIEEKHGFVVSVDKFKETLSKTVISVSRNEMRPELSGLYFGFFIERFKGLVVAGTDSYRLAEKKIEIEQGNDTVECIVPARAVQEIIRLLSITRTEQNENNVRLWVSENQFAVRYNNFEMTTRLIDGTYPDYAQIIPTEFRTTAQVPLDQLVKKIKTAGLFTNVGVNAVSFDVRSAEKTLEISSVSAQTGQYTSKIEAEVKGENNKILLNHKYVLDGLQQISSEKVDFKLNNAENPCVFSPSDDNSYTYIVMPIRQ